MPEMIVAYDQRRGIGADNDLLWQRDLPADLARFRRLTMGGAIIMGRNTYESIGRALPGRQNIVVTSRPLNAPDTIAVDSLAAAYRVARQPQFVIGGESIYTQALPNVDTIHATEVHSTFPQSTIFFPPLDDSWREVAREAHVADQHNAYDYDFVTYRRR